MSAPLLALGGQAVFCERIELDWLQARQVPRGRPPRFPLHRCRDVLTLVVWFGACKRDEVGVGICPAKASHCGFPARPDCCPANLEFRGAWPANWAFKAQPQRQQAWSTNSQTPSSWLPIYVCTVHVAHVSNRQSGFGTRPLQDTASLRSIVCPYHTQLMARQRWPESELFDTFIMRLESHILGP